MEHCCNKMNYFISENKNTFDTDDIILYVSKFDEYGIIVHDFGKSYIRIKYCPWCGKRLPNSKRDMWFDELEKMGIKDPLEEEIPTDFKSDYWWKHKQQ